jgi:Methyl-accepting chemotaxis protein (MCP) signalling domain
MTWAAKKTNTAEPEKSEAADQSISMKDIAGLTSEVRGLAQTKTQQIHKITHRMRMLALNAMIEAARAGDMGRGFSIVAQEVRGVSTEVEAIAEALQEELGGRVESLERLTCVMAEQAQAQRLIDLALNAIEIIDRNLYERTCDVRWWATDSAIVEALANKSPATADFATHRLGVILSAYTVYMDLWVCAPDGTIIASGRPDQYPVVGQSAKHEPWFDQALRLGSGDDYTAGDIATCAMLKHQPSATYAATIREDGLAHGRVLGVLAAHFDWAPQAKAVVEGVRLTSDEKQTSRVLIVDAARRIIASSDGQGILRETLNFQPNGRASGCDRSNGQLIAFHATPGYETYSGLGWHGVIVQK